MSLTIRVYAPVFTPYERTLLRDMASANHHDDGGHHVANKKPHFLPWAADIMQTVIGELAGKIDPNMRLYKLDEGGGEVPPHVDEDFVDEEGNVAKLSVLVYLNDDYEGGETCFGEMQAPFVPPGGFIVFPHDVQHSACKVTKGTKYIVKTDVFVKS